MNKTLHFLMVPAMLLCVNASAQKKAPAFRFPWQGTQTMDQAQMRLADSLYGNLPEGEKLQLTLLSETEENLEPAKKAQLTYQRASMLMAHYRKAKLLKREYMAEMVPFTMPNVVRTNDLTRASSISVARKSQTHLVLSKNVSRATAKAAVEFDADFSREMQQFAFDPGDGIDATLASGTRIFIPANSLQQPNGQAPDCGQVTLRVSEYLDLEAMAMKAMSTTASGKKLQTAGMWHIDVICNGKELVMKPGQKYEIDVNMTGEAKNMKVFTGQLRNGLLNWKEETDDKVLMPGQQGEITNQVQQVNVEADEMEQVNEEYNIMNDAVFGSGNSYGLQLNDFGWINCDAFDETQQLTDLMVYGEIGEATNVMLVYGKRKSVLPGYLCEDKKSVKFSNIAADETAMLVVFKKTDDKGGVVRYTRILQPGKDKSVGVSLTASTAEKLRNEIRSRLSDL